MRNLLQTLKNSFKDSSFLKAFILSLLPVVLVALYSCFCIYSYNQKNIELLRNNYITKLESTCKTNEASLSNSSTLIHLLSNNEKFTNLLKSEIKGDFESGAYDIIGTLFEFKRNNSIIDSISIYNRNSNVIYSDTGIYDADNYFTNIYTYQDYPYSFWQNYNALLSDRRALGPSVANSMNMEKTVIPIVFTKVSKNHTRSLIIINAKLLSLMSEANTSKPTDNSFLFIANNNTRSIFSQSPTLQNMIGDDFFESISYNTVSIFDYNINQKKHLMISYSPNTSILGYAYVAAIPYGDIKSPSQIAYMLFFIGVLTVLICFFLAFFVTRHIFEPFTEFSQILDRTPQSTDERNIVQTVRSSISSIISENASLSDEISKILPLAQERCLISFLNANTHFETDEINLDVNVEFKYEYFCSIIIKLQPSQQFYREYSIRDYEKIKSGINNIIHSYFHNQYDIYTITTETDSLYVLLNFPDDVKTDTIAESLQEFQEVMDYDKNYMSTKIGIGGVYPGLSGLKKSHDEAISTASSVLKISTLKVHCPDEYEPPSSYNLNLNTENAILNNLISGKIDEAETLIEEVMRENVQNNITTPALIQLYCHILGVVFKVLRTKNLPYDPEGKGDSVLLSEIANYSVADIKKTLQSYISIIDDHTNYPGKKNDIQEIITYIDSHYKEDIGLDSVAHSFNISPKYLSKLIKDKIGINFTAYLLELRIKYAKEFLSKTDMSINDIFVEVGFNNRNTFIRSFKKSTGLTPSEYRKNKKLLSGK